MSAGGGLGLSPALIDTVYKIDGRLKVSRMFQRWVLAPPA